MKENVKDNIFNSHYNVIKSGIVNIFVVYPLYVLTESEIENITLFNILLGIFLIDTVEYFLRLRDCFALELCKLKNLIEEVA